MSLTSYPIRRIGPLALAESGISQSASLLGSTSRGLFILTAKQHVIFLSIESHCGPWTANLLALPPGWQGVMVGKSIHVQSGRLILPAAQACFDATVAEHWQPPIPDFRHADLAGLPARRDAVQALLLQRGERGFSPLLAGEINLIPVPLLPVQSAVHRLCAALRASDAPSAIQAGEALLGFGTGLTPSGDDLLCGVLLGLARWGGALGLVVPPGFSSSLVERARQRTTALSASLLEAAAQGMADERLLLAADGLLTAAASPEAIAQALLGYGNSSGLDFWIGLTTLTQ